MINSDISVCNDTRTFMQKLVMKLAHRAKLRYYHHESMWYHDQEFIEYFKMWNPKVSPGNVKDRQYMLFNLARGTAHLNGDTAECGVYQGSGSRLIMHASRLKEKEKTHHMFDSFEGLSAPTEDDLLSEKAAYNWQKGDLAVGLKAVQERLKGFDRVSYYKGWIPKTFLDVSKETRFSLVHIDVDLFQPTLDSLDFFYPRIEKGGVIICDDYHSRSCPGARKALDQFFSDKPEMIVKTVTDQAFIIKG